MSDIVQRLTQPEANDGDYLVPMRVCREAAARIEELEAELIRHGTIPMTPLIRWHHRTLEDEQNCKADSLKERLRNRDSDTVKTMEEALIDTSRKLIAAFGAASDAHATIAKLEAEIERLRKRCAAYEAWAAELMTCRTPLIDRIMGQERGKGEAKPMQPYDGTWIIPKE